MTPLTWRQFGTLATSVDPGNDAAINPNYPGSPPWDKTSLGGLVNAIGMQSYFEPWVGGTWHEAIGRLRLSCGGGHGDGAMNLILAIDLFADSPSWFLETPPSGAIGNPGPTAYPCDDNNEGSNVYWDKLPRSTHTYDLLVSRGNEVWLVQAGAPFRSGGSGTGGNVSQPGIFRWARRSGWRNVAQGTTDAIGSSGATGGAVAACYDEQRDRIYVVCNNSNPIRYWDCAAGGKTDTGVYTNVSGGTTRMVRIPDLDMIAVLDVQHSGHFALYDYGRTAGASVHQPGATGSVPTSPSYSSPFFYSNGVWVPGWGGGVGAIMCWHGGTSIRVLTPPATNQTTSAWAWSTLNAHASNSLDPGNPNSNGVFGRLAYSRRLRGLILAKSASALPYFFALE